MECNKDEAIRAMDIAKRKVTENDYTGAKTFAVKAQNLYPQLDGLKQVLMLIDVYISAGNKINGGEPDWYGVLGVDPLADDGVVKKQYRKLALLLHPDKNKCEGAEGAFKLILEAWSLLSDKVKRIAFDQKRRVVMVKEVKPRKGRKQKQEPKEPKQPTKKQKQPPKEPKQPVKKQPKQPTKKQKQPANGQEQPANEQHAPPKQAKQEANEQQPKQEANGQQQPPKQPKEETKEQQQPPKQPKQEANGQQQPPKQPKKEANEQQQPPKQQKEEENEQQQPPKQPKQPPPPKQPANQQEQRPKQQRQQPSPQKQQPRQPSSTGSRTGRGRSNKPTSKVTNFWTMCNICGMRQQYVRVLFVNKNVKCGSCRVSFQATEIESTPQATNENTNGASCGRDSFSSKDEEATRGIENSDFKVEERARKKLKTDGSCRG
ncbi:unnamed protein product [Eruca vesicaria subsp. sativa]|uniref:J domain-containing protein n=1 Tax=Eruca vesicaria subsp. sativa TaxID=29727 RepID=A0ABC8JXZ5_ERUVS|nr:unnamed protein product [Eruca vesicaria subsp. sativa]